MGFNLYRRVVGFNLYRMVVGLNLYCYGGIRRSNIN